MDIVCCMAMVFISLNVRFIAVLGMLSLSFRLFIQGMCVVALAPAVITISESTFQPLLMKSSISGWYFSVLAIIVFGENLSLKYVNLINCIVRLVL